MLQIWFYMFSSCLSASFVDIDVQEIDPKFSCNQKKPCKFREQLCRIYLHVLSKRRLSFRYLLPLGNNLMQAYLLRRRTVKNLLHRLSTLCLRSCMHQRSQRGGGGRGATAPPPPNNAFSEFCRYIWKFVGTCKPTSMSFVPTKYLMYRQNIERNSSLRI